MNAAGDDPGAGESAWPADAIEVGRIGGAWGVKGELRVLPYAAEPQALLRARQWFVRPPDAAAHAPQARLLTILRARSHGDGVVAQFCRPRAAIQREQLADDDFAEHFFGLGSVCGHARHAAQHAEQGQRVLHYIRVA